VKQHSAYEPYRELLIAASRNEAIRSATPHLMLRGLGFSREKRALPSRGVFARPKDGAFDITVVDGAAEERVTVAPDVPSAVRLIEEMLGRLE
jgi:hypothetical protein